MSVEATTRPDRALKVGAQNDPQEAIPAPETADIAPETTLLMAVRPRRVWGRHVCAQTALDRPVIAGDACFSTS